MISIRNLYRKPSIAFMIMLMVFLVILSVSMSGCSSANPSPLSTKEPSEMALQVSDLPEGYILQNGSPMTGSEIEKSIRDMGWKKGYLVKFKKTGPTSADITYILQEVSLYPVNQVNNVLSFRKTKVMTPSTDGALIEELPDPGIGDSGAAYRTADEKAVLKIYVIYFIKGDVYESLSMVGTSPDYETLKKVARAAVAKIG